MKRLHAIALGLLLCAAGAAWAHAETSEPKRIPAFVSILPQKYFVERVGGDRVDVSVLVGPGRSPATYEPTPRQMSDLAAAHVFFRIGVPFEKSLMPKIRSLQDDLVIVDLRKGIELRRLRSEHDHGDHEAEGDHSHESGAPDPHIWLDPVLVKTQAETIRNALSRIDPAHAEIYEKNLKAFQADLDRINARIAEVLAPLKGKTVFVFHPAYGYFTDRYGLKQKAVETGGKEPSAKQLANLIDEAKRSNVKVIFVQPQFDQQNAKTIAKAIGGAVVSLDPLASDYLENLRGMASKIEEALGNQSQ